MKFLAVLLASLMSVSPHLQASKEELVGLESLKWKYRVLLVFVQEPFVSTALQNLSELEEGIEERDLIWFLLADDQLHTNYRGRLGHELRELLLDQHFTPTPVETIKILIGKDGSLKSRDPGLDLDSTFALIDQMPMRKEEMRRR